MNEKILQLAYKSGFVHEHMTTGEVNDKLKSFEKIANLIIQEYERQEPVAWIRASGLDMLKEVNIGYATVYASEGMSNHSTPLYAKPPKHEWVGLSDKEVEEVSGSFTEFEGFKQGALWAEQKLKELNT